MNSLIASVALEPILFALCGGFFVNVLRLIELSHLPRSQRPATFRDPLYVLQFVTLPVLGAFLAQTYESSGSHLTPFVAVNIGASAPLIFKSLAGAAPIVGSRNVD